MRRPSIRLVTCLFVAFVLVLASVKTSSAQSTVPCYSYDEQCKGIIKKGIIIGAIGVGAIVALKIWSSKRASDRREREAEIAAGPPSSLRVYFDEPKGQVFHHLVLNARSNCPITWQSSGATIESGQMPPGLFIGSPLSIQGTPEEPGIFEVKIRVNGLACRGQSYASQVVETRFTIEP